MHRNAQGRTEAHGSAQNRTGARRSTQELAGTRSNAHRCTGTHRSARDRPEARTVARRSARDPPGEHTGPHRSARDRPEGHTGPHREAQQRLSGLLQQAVGVSLTQRILVWKLSLRALCNGNRSGNPFARALPLELCAVGVGVRSRWCMPGSVTSSLVADRRGRRLIAPIRIKQGPTCRTIF